MCCPWNVADALKTVLHVLNDNMLSSSCGGFNNERVHCNFKYLLWTTCVLHEDWAYLKFDHCTSWYTLCSSLSSFQDWRTFFPLQCNCLGDCLDLRFMDMMQFNDLLSIPTPFQWDRGLFFFKVKYFAPNGHLLHLQLPHFGFHPTPISSILSKLNFSCMIYCCILNKYACTLSKIRMWLYFLLFQIFKKCRTAFTLIVATFPWSHHLHYV